MNPPIPIQKPLPDMIEDVVKATETIILPYLQSVDPRIEQLHYEHGHPREIVETLAEMNKTQKHQFKKYPLVALFEDIREKVGANLGLYGTAPLNLIIAYETEADYDANDRYDHIFRPILLPIYQVLMTQFDRSEHFQFAGKLALAHDKTNHVYWGKKGRYGVDGNIFEDRLDAVEIENLIVSIKKTECKIKTVNTLNF